MKMTRKLIPALAMLLISAVLMSTASYAWFSMNTKVTATGMSITAKNESQYLQIVAGADGVFSDTAAQISAQATLASKSLRPTSLVGAIVDDGESINAYAGSTTLYWVEAFSSDPADHEKRDDMNYDDVTTKATSTGAENIYTLYNVFKVRMNPTTGVSSARNLYVDSVKIQAVKADDADAAALLDSVRVAIVGPDAGVIFDADGNKYGKDEGSGVSTVIMNTVDSTGKTIQVYVYFEGEADTTINNNIDPSSFTVEFTLKID